MNYNYTVLIEAEPTGGFHASCPALKGCHSEGETEDEARANIREAIEVYIESLRAHGETAPRETMMVESLTVAV